MAVLIWLTALGAATSPVMTSPKLTSPKLTSPELASPELAFPELAWREVRRVDPTIVVRLSYSGPNNAFRHTLYPSNTALLRAPVAKRLARVQARLQKQGLGLCVWDAYRPKSVQARMWKLRPDARQRYLANPRNVSKHSRGAAVDVTLVDRHGRELEMPTPHDEFSPRAHRNAVRGVSPQARRNARLLREAMQAEGFSANAYEWWHFTAPDWRRYPASDRPLPAAAPAAGMPVRRR